MLPVYLDCLFLIAPSVFSNVYIHQTLQSPVKLNDYSFCINKENALHVYGVVLINVSRIGDFFSLIKLSVTSYGSTASTTFDNAWKSMASNAYFISKSTKEAFSNIVLHGACSYPNTLHTMIHSQAFRIKTMFGSSLPPVVCRRTHVLFTLFV